MTPTISRVLSGVAVTALAAAGVFLTAAPASAADSTYDSGQITWNTSVNSGELYGSQSYDRTEDLFGWNYNAFDEVGALQLTVDGVPVGSFYALEENTSIDETADRAVYTADAFYLDQGTPAYDFGVHLVMTIQGNFVTWEYSVDGPDASRVAATFHADFYADDDTETTVLSDTIIVGGGTAYDSAVSGLRMTSNDAQASPWGMLDTDEYTVTANGANTDGELQLTVDAFVIGYDVCSFDAAYDFAIEVMGDVDGNIGQSFPDVMNCLTIAPVALIAGQAVDTQVSSTIDPALNSQGSYFGDLYELSTSLGEFPAGLTGTLELDENGISSFALTGTAPAAGTYTVPVRIVRTENGEGEGGSESGYPLQANLIITVTDPESAVDVPVDETPSELAETGSDSAPLLGLFGALLLVGAGAALTVARRQRA